MPNAKFYISVIAYGFTSLLLVIGFLIYSGSAIGAIFMDTSESTGLGIRLMQISVILYIIDTLVVVLLYWDRVQNFR